MRNNTEKKKKQFAVLGLGDFGMCMAKELAGLGGQVLAVDDDEDHIEEISEYVTSVVKGDCGDAEVISTLNLGEMDAVIIGIGNNLAASVVTTIIAKEEGAPYILAKVNNSIQETALKKVGVDQTIWVERAMGERIARSLIHQGKLLDSLDLSEEYSLVEVRMPAEWVGKSLRELNLRVRYGFNVVAYKKNGQIDPTPDPDLKLEQDASILLVGADEKLEKIL